MKFFRLVSVSLALFCANTSRASAPFCDLPSVHRIQVPLYFDRVGSPTFSYAYQMVGAYDPALPTVIYLPGGPGDTSISNLDSGDRYDNFDFFWSGVPSRGWNVIFTDLRSTGCNYGDAQAFPDDSVSTITIAHDLLQIVKSLGLQAYYLYGYSYGAELATVTASIAESQGIGPKGIVLAGAMSRPMDDPSHSLSATWINQWNALRQRLPESVLSRIDSNAPPLGLSNSDWKNFVTMGVRFGRMGENGNVHDWLYEKLMSLAPSTPEGDQEFLEGVQEVGKYYAAWSQVSPDEGNAEERAFVLVGCTETAHVYPGFQLVNGLATLMSTNRCQGTTPKNVYEASNWPVKANIYYFAGENDAAVDYTFQQRHHLESETQANRFFVTLPSGGHDLIGEVLGDCSDVIWNSMLHDGAGLERALSHCNDHPKMEFFGAQ